MSRQYHPITKEEMDDFLLDQNFSVMPDPRNKWKSYVYGKGFKFSTNNGVIAICLRIYSSIPKKKWATEKARKKGKDTIGVAPFWRSVDERYSSGKGIPRRLFNMTKVLRIKTWRKNLQERIDRWHHFVKPCAYCKQRNDRRPRPMIIRYYGGKAIFGCKGYPKYCEGKPIDFDKPKEYAQKWIAETR